jgi:hypothetical protein
VGVTGVVGVVGVGVGDDSDPHAIAKMNGKNRT